MTCQECPEYEHQDANYCGNCATALREKCHACMQPLEMYDTIIENIMGEIESRAVQANSLDAEIHHDARIREIHNARELARFTWHIDSMFNISRDERAYWDAIDLLREYGL